MSSSSTHVSSLQSRCASHQVDRRRFTQGAAGAGIASMLGGSLLLSPSGIAAQESGATLSIAASGDVDTLDPHVSQLLLYGNMMRRPCFSTLVQYDKDLEYVPDLAESWENPDDRTYVFHLRQDAKYHDGQPIEASHVQFSFERIAEKGTVFSSRVANVESYEVLDAHTIQIRLTEVQADFIDGLTKLSVIAPEHEETIESQPIGSGPFRFVEWEPNDRLVLERNLDYWDSDRPGVDSLTFRIMPEPQVALTNLQAGEIDGILEFPVSQAAFIEDAEDYSPIVVPTSSIHIYELMGQNSEPIWSSVAVRQALAHCLDKDSIQQAVFSGEGRQKTSFAPVDSWAYEEQSAYAYDLERARELLEEAGYGDGFEFSCILPSGNPEAEQATTIWQASLAEVGLTMNIETQELSVWLDNYINHTYDITWNVFPGFADPNYFVSFALQPHFADQWQNAEAEDLANRANEVLDTEERAALYGQLQQIFAEELPILVIQEAPAASVVSAELDGWQINPLGEVVLDQVTVASDES